MTHKIYLDEEVEQLKIISDRASNTNEKRESRIKLRKHLIQHYKEYPLTSQKEALKEQLRKDTKSNGNGLRLVLKLSSKTNIKPKIKTPTAIVKKPEKIPKVNEPIAAFQPSAIPLLEVEEDTKPYCFCKQPSFGDMIACDNENGCPNGEWFHYKCVGLLNRVEALKYTTGKVKWFCSDHCREAVENILKVKTKKRRRRRNVY